MAICRSLSIFDKFDKVNPVKIMQKAYEISVTEGKNEVCCKHLHCEQQLLGQLIPPFLQDFLGTSTAVVAILSNEILQVASIGDSCCLFVQNSCEA